MSSEVAEREFTAEQARELTERIRAGVAELLPLIKQAFERRADRALGYENWHAYCDAELRGLRLPVEDRRAAVAELRGAGMSTRAIGAALGVGNKTVHRDLEASVSSDTDGERVTVASLDGRQRPASAPTRPTLDQAEPATVTYKDDDGEPYTITPAGEGNWRESPFALSQAMQAEEREPIQEPEWSEDEELLCDRLGAGETVVVSLRPHHANLVRWAEREGLLVRIDRRSDWGNPFELPADGDRDTVIRSYAEHYLPHKPSLLACVDTLRGKALACWCAPEACHGDVLKARADT